MRGATASPDPYLLSDTKDWSVYFGHRAASGLTIRSAAINPVQRTLVLLTSGQSLLVNITPTLYLPTNSSAIDQFSIYDGQLYNINGPVLGSTYNPALLGGSPGNVSVRVVDKLQTNGVFDRIILANLSLGSTFAAEWATGRWANRTSVAMARLARLGIVPGMTGVTFGCIYAIGNSDYVFGTPQADFVAQSQTWISNLRATGFNGRIFVCLESGSGQTSNIIRSAQASLWNGTTICSGGDIDSSTITTQDGVHPDDAGAATMATIIYNAMRASGAPY